MCGVVLCLLLVAAVQAEESPICLKFRDGESHCTSLPVPDGRRLSELLSTTLSTYSNRSGVRELHPRIISEPIDDNAQSLTYDNHIDDDGEELFQFLHGPEALDVHDNFLYATTGDGAIHKVNLNTGEDRVLHNASTCESAASERCGRPLGLRVNGSTLICAVARVGLIQVDTKTGESKDLVTYGSIVSGHWVSFADDLDVDWDRGLVYFSDASRNWHPDAWAMSMLETETSGRVMRHNLTSGETELFAEGLSFPNGVQISTDRKFLLVAETSAKRVTKFPLDATAALPVTGARFTRQPLPGFPDNIRPSKNGGYWVALVIGNHNGAPTLLDELKKRPEDAKALGDWLLSTGEIVNGLNMLMTNRQRSDVGAKFQDGSVLSDGLLTLGMAVELDSEGNIIRVLQSRKYRAFTHVLETDHHLYFGSILNQYVLRAPNEHTKTNKSLSGS